MQDLITKDKQKLLLELNQYLINARDLNRLPLLNAPVNDFRNAFEQLKTDYDFTAFIYNDKSERLFLTKNLKIWKADLKARQNSIKLLSRKLKKEGSLDLKLQIKILSELIAKVSVMEHILRIKKLNLERNTDSIQKLSSRLKSDFDKIHGKISDREVSNALNLPSIVQIFDSLKIQNPKLWKKIRSRIEKFKPVGNYSPIEHAKSEIYKPLISSIREKVDKYLPFDIKDFDLEKLYNSIEIYNIFNYIRPTPFWGPEGFAMRYCQAEQKTIFVGLKSQIRSRN